MHDQDGVKEGVEQPTVPEGVEQPTVPEGVEQPTVSGLRNRNRLYPDLSEFVGGGGGGGGDGGQQPECAPSPAPRRSPRSYGLCLVLVLVLIAAVALFCMVFKSSPDGGEGGSGVSNCTQGCIRDAVRRRLRAEFPAQPTRTWVTIAACLGRQFTDDMRRPDAQAPSVLLFAPAGVTLDRLLDRLSALLADGIDGCGCATGGCRQFDAAGAAAADTDAAAASLRRQLNEAAGAAAVAGVRCLTVPRADRLPGGAAAIFYRLADTTDAPHRPFLYVLTVAEEPQLPDGGGGGGGGALATEAEVLERLRTSWQSSGLPPDSFSPLWARIGNNVLIVTPEAGAG